MRFGVRLFWPTLYSYYREFEPIGMVWYGTVNVDLYSAVITKVSNALNTLVSGEKPGFQALSKGLICCYTTLFINPHDSSSRRFVVGHPTTQNFLLVSQGSFTADVDYAATHVPCERPSRTPQ